MENDSKIPWVVFNLDELIDHLRKQGFIKILVVRQYKNFVGNGPRYLPEDLLTSGTARTSILGIRNEGLNEDLQGVKLLESEVNFVSSVKDIRIPRSVRALNTLHQYFGH